MDPTRLRPGQTIKLPDLPAAERAEHHAAPRRGAVRRHPPAPPRPPPSIAPTRVRRQGRRQPLPHLPTKLYGNANKVDALYDLNKDRIGPDRERLKLGMTLKLPEPPTSLPVKESRPIGKDKSTRIRKAQEETDEVAKKQRRRPHHHFGLSRSVVCLFRDSSASTSRLPAHRFAAASGTYEPFHAQLRDPQRGKNPQQSVTVADPDGGGLGGVEPEPLEGERDGDAGDAGDEVVDRQRRRHDAGQDRRVVRVRAAVAEQSQRRRRRPWCRPITRPVNKPTQASR